MSNLDIEDETERTAAIYAAAEDLWPQLEARAEDAEKLGRIPENTLADLMAAGLTRLGQPRRYGGAELPLNVITEAFATVARGCASSAWVCGVYADHGCIVSMFPEAVTDEVWGKTPEAVVSAALPPLGSAEAVDDGWRLSGKWGFLSGCDYADWFILGTMLPDDDGQPVRHFLLVPRSEVTILDDWDVMGLRATGSKSVTVDGTLVPLHRAIRFDEINGGAEARGNLETRPLYRLPHSSTVPFVRVATSLCIVERLVAMTASEISHRVSRGNRLAEIQSVQLNLAEASVDADCARLLVERDTTATMSAMSERRPLTAMEVARNRRDMGHAVRLCRRAADRLFEMNGARAMFTNNVIQMKFRDIRCASLTTGFSWDIGATLYGKAAFDLEPPDAAVKV